MNSLIYDSFAHDLMRGRIDLVTDTVKVLLVSGYKPSAAHSRRSDITKEVPTTAGAAANTGYRAGGIELTGKRLSPDGTFYAQDVVWPNATIEATGAVLYKSRGGAASEDELIGYFAGRGASTAADYKVTWDAEGILAK